VRFVPLKDQGEFSIAAQQAALLWRYDPPRVRGCGVPARVALKVQFTMQ
jgi:hypothetical protein